MSPTALQMQGACLRHHVSGRAERKFRRGLACVVLGMVLARPGWAIIYRDDETDATSLALAQQPQFNGTGQVGVANTGFGPNGSGAAIAPDWVITAKHLFEGAPTGSTGAFYLNGSEYTGPVYMDANSDLALIHLTGIAGSSAPFTGLPSSINPIQPNIPADNISPLNQIVWTVGFGGAANYSNQNGSLSYNTGVRAGTNVITNFNSNAFWGADNNNTAPDATRFESSTAPGDSGGPMYVQHGNTWYISGVTFGPGDFTPTAVAGQPGAQDTPVTNNFIANTISSVTGQPYQSTAAPTYHMMWKPLPGVTGNSGGSALWNLTDTNFTDGKLQYQWDNSAAEDVTFGSSTVAAGIVTITPTYLKGGIITSAGVTVHHLTFNEPIGDGTYNLTGGTLPTGSAGSTAPGSITFTTSSNSAGNPTITLNWNATISAPIVLAAGATLAKDGPGTLAISGANTGFLGVLQIQAGTVDAQSATALGNGGFRDDDSTYVLAGGTLEIDGGYSSDEHIHLNGTGAGGNGALYNAGGSNTLTDPLSLDADATIRVAPGTSLNIAGGTTGNPPAQIYGGHLLTLVGGGTLNLNGAAHVSGIVLNGGTFNQQSSTLIDSTATLTISGGTYKLNANTQTFTAVTLTGGSFSLSLGDHTIPGAAGGNGMIVTGALMLSQSIVFILSTGVGFGVGTYDLIGCTGTLTDDSNHFAGWSISGLPTDEKAFFTLGMDAGLPVLQLVVMPVPEPSAYLWCMVGAAAAFMRRRRARAHLVHSTVDRVDWRMVSVTPGKQVCIK